MRCSAVFCALTERIRDLATVPLAVVPVAGAGIRRALRAAVQRDDGLAAAARARQIAGDEPSSSGCSSGKWTSAPGLIRSKFRSGLYCLSNQTGTL